MSPRTGRGRRLVYSTGTGRACPDCGRPAAQCACGKSDAAPAGDGIVRVRREAKGRGGKQVTVITGVPLPAAELRELGRALKARCGSGGTARDGRIEVQGDHRAVVVEELRKRGWTVKLAGG